MYVIGFDEERQRYKCFDLGIYTDNIQSIYLCKEEDLDFVSEDSKYRNNNDIGTALNKNGSMNYAIPSINVLDITK